MSTSNPRTASNLLRILPTRRMYSKPLPKELRLMIWAQISINESEARRRDAGCWTGTRLRTEKEMMRYLHLQSLDVAAIKQAGGNLGYQSMLFDSFEKSIPPLLLPPSTASNSSLHDRAREEYEDSLRETCFVFVLERRGGDETDDPWVGPSFLWPLDNISRYLAYKKPPWLDVPDDALYLVVRDAFLQKVRHIEVQYSPTLLKLAAEHYYRYLVQLPAADEVTQLEITFDNCTQLSREMVDFYLATKKSFKRLSVTFVITEHPFHTDEGLYSHPGWALPYATNFSHTHAWGPILQFLERFSRVFLTEIRFRAVYRRKDSSVKSGYREIELLPGPKDLQAVLKAGPLSVIRIRVQETLSEHEIHVDRSVWMKRTMMRILDLHGLTFDDTCSSCSDIVDEPSLDSEIGDVRPGRMGSLGMLLSHDPVVTPFGSMENLMLSDSEASSMGLEETSDDDRLGDWNDEEV